MPQRETFGPEYFRAFYRNYERQNPAYKLRFYRDLILAHVVGFERPRILDIGCAFGKFLGSLAPDWVKFGVDRSEFAVARGRKVHPDVRFVVASGTAIPLRGPFQAIVAFDVLEHLPDLKAVEEFVGTALSPGGVFVFVVPVYDGPLGWLVHKLDRDPTHIRKRERAFWLEWARKNFELDTWCGVFRYLMPGGIYINYPSRVLRNQAPAVAVVARRKRG